MKDKKLIVLIGEPLAGKKLASDYIVEKYLAKRILFSAIFTEMLDILQIPSGRETISVLAGKLREGFGDSVLVPAMLARVGESAERLVILDGARKTSEIEDLKKSGYEMLVLKIAASPEVRYERYKQRQEKVDDGKDSFEEFASLSKKYSSERDVVATGELADYAVENNGTPEGLYEQIDRVLASFV